jgi:hypothetical protein
MLLWVVAECQHREQLDIDVVVSMAVGEVLAHCPFMTCQDQFSLRRYEIYDKLPDSRSTFTLILYFI